MILNRRRLLRRRRISHGRYVLGFVVGTVLFGISIDFRFNGRLPYRLLPYVKISSKRMRARLYFPCRMDASGAERGATLFEVKLNFLPTTHNVQLPRLNVNQH